MRVVPAGERIGLDGIDDREGRGSRDTIHLQTVIALECPDGMLGVPAEVAIGCERMAIGIAISEARQQLLEGLDLRVVVAWVEFQAGG